ncbi:MAG: surf-like protein [Vezdaea aestivalis]|nr:MAG: surf-like protein [Vezdaea aestivalis]
MQVLRLHPAPSYHRIHRIARAPSTAIDLTRNVSSRQLNVCQRRYYNPQPGDASNFESIVDRMPRLVKTGEKHGLGLIILAIMPITAFALGTWQVQRLDWKSKLIAKFEDRLIKEPLPLPMRIDPGAIADFDYRRVFATGVLRHDQEMLVGPRMRDGTEGCLVYTPLERGDASNTILVNRGWISKTLLRQSDRKDGLPQGLVTIQGLLREPPKKNMFTPNNKPEFGKFYFPDIQQMSQHAGSQAVLVEETMTPDLLKTYEREAKGIPIARTAEVNLRNTHAQYIFTWYALATATSIMFWMVVKKPPTQISQQVRRTKEWS